MAGSAQRWEELLEKARIHKESGNSAFKDQNYKEAKKCYHHCLLNAKAVLHIPTNHGIPGEPSSPTFPLPLPNGPEPCSGDNLSDPPPVPPPLSLHPLAQDAKALITTCYNNLAACIIQNASSCKREDFLRAVEYCDKVLLDSPTNAKAIFRKGAALFHLREYDRAVELFQRAQDLDPSSDHQKMLDKCKRELNKYEHKSRREFRGMFDRQRQIPTNAQNGHPPVQNGNARDLEDGHDHGPSTSGLGPDE